MVKMNMLWFTIFLLCLNIVTTSEDATLGIDKLNPGSSCNDIYQRNPFSRGRTGYYWIATNEGLFSVTCNMKLRCGGVEEDGCRSLMLIWIELAAVQQNGIKLHLRGDCA